MRSNYSQIGKYIRQVKVKNTDGSVSVLRGVSIEKFYMPSVANINGVDLKKYKVVSPGQFAFNPMHVGRDKVLPISLLKSDQPVIVSPAYTVFEIINDEVSAEYLMMWFSRPEFDRNAWFKTDGNVRGGLSWDDFCEIELPVISPADQKKIVNEYDTIIKRISLKRELNQKAEKAVHTLFTKYFKTEESEGSLPVSTYVDFGPTYNIPKLQEVTRIDMADVQESAYAVKATRKTAPFSGTKIMNGDTLLARITPCLENGKTAFVDILKENEVAVGSTEFIVMKPKPDTSPYWVYCLARDEEFRLNAISSMVGSTGRQRADVDYLKNYLVPPVNEVLMNEFHDKAHRLFGTMKKNSTEVKLLLQLRDILLARISKLEYVS